MNIKSVTNSIIQVEPVGKKQDVKTLDTSKDRDPGQGQSGEGFQDESYNEEDVQKALEYLKKHPGVKKNNFQVKLEEVNAVKLFIIRDYTGKVIRRLNILDAVHASRQATVDTEDQRGGLLNKAI